MSPACRPVDDWPELLLGPMVRRVTLQSAAVFIATSVECTARLALKRGRRNHAEIAAGDFAGSVGLHRIGERLWVGLLEAPIPAGIGVGDVVSYDVELDGPAGTHRLNSLGELGDPEVSADDIALLTPLGYEPGVLPSFLIPPGDADELRLAHASCRRPHGGVESEPDALAILDEVVALSLDAAEPMPPPPSAAPPPESNRERPHQLILTGDQIYADDVAASLLAALTEAGIALLGWQEELPGGIVPSPVPLSGELDFLVWPGWRSRYLAMEDIVEVAPRGSYDFAANHTLTFGEFCAMYLFVWSDALWKRSDGGVGVELPGPGFTLPLDDLNTWVDRINTWTAAQPQNQLFAWGLQAATFLNQFSSEVDKTWGETQPAAERFGASVRKVRRLLANVATYTIFDDHDVTDDWFLNRALADVQLGVDRDEDSWSKDLGPRLLRNALSAYTIFQHWGNVPEDFAGNGPGAQVLLGWEVEPSDDGIAPPSLAGAEQTGPDMDPATHAADAALGIDKQPSTVKERGTDRTDFGRLRFDYVVPFHSHRLLVLDTRTWRFFPDPAPAPWPENLDPAETAPADTTTLLDLRTAAAALSGAAATAGDSVQVYADLFAAAVDAAQASGATATKAALLRVATATEALIGCAPPPWSDTNAVTVTVEVDQLRDFLNATGGPPPREDQLWQAGTRLRRVASVRVERKFESLSHSVAALAGLLENAQTGSSRALAASVAKVLNATPADVLTTFAPDLDFESTIAPAIATGIELVTDKLAEYELDRRSDWFFRDGSAQLGAGLISEAALEFQLTDAIDDDPDAPPTILVSAAPIFGNSLVEIAQRGALVGTTLAGQAAAPEHEYEAWSVNTPAMLSLFKAAGGLKRCVVLSGDVHYANTSINDAELLADGGVTRYIQLTSSSAHNADGKTTALGFLDDALWTDCGELTMAQMSLGKLLAPGAPEDASGPGWAQEYVEEGLEEKFSLPNFSRWLYSKLEELQMTPLEFLRWQIEAPYNSITAWAAEAFYSTWAVANFVSELAEDPMGKMFGDYLFARDVLRQQLVDLYNDVGVDPSLGVQVRRTMLRDLRTGRLDEYRATERFDKADPDTANIVKYAQVAYVQTVGSSNVGLVQFLSTGGEISGVRHEILWFPVPEPASAEGRWTEQPAGLVVGAELPRVDWMGTEHKCSWTAYRHRVDEECGPGGL